MMNIFAVTACLKRCSVAISYDGAVYEANENTSASANLVHIADRLIKANEIDMKKIGGVITAAGPGSFTGIRVAQSFAKSIALSLGISSVSVDYFDVIDYIYAMKMQEGANRQQGVTIVIRSEKNHAYFRRNSEVGIDSYENIARTLNDSDVVIGDAVNEIAPHMTSPELCRIEYVGDFRDVRHFLPFAHRLTKDSNISPLYINAS